MGRRKYVISFDVYEDQGGRLNTPVGQRINWRNVESEQFTVSKNIFEIIVRFLIRGKEEK